ncbi:aquaporin Z [Flavobacteriaceae bacterium]|nr:aquaporin Z [Flavobacteriaceae bacterium]MDC1472235.1 aquaporin Z [Flavobacteriaceae bacterium]MDC1539116.1 aquaporin Z [Flavobacteriaceae bacterium]
MKKLFAEFFGTFWLVFGGCGSAIFAAGYPDLGIGFIGVALAFGLTVMTMAFAVGAISGAHFNPAVTLGLWAGGRFPSKDVLGYIIAQVFGGIVAAATLFLIVSGKSDFVSVGGFAANGYADLSPGGFSMGSVFITEFVTTAFFIIIILGSTGRKATKEFAPIAIGLALTLIHLISIPISNTSVNPARSTGQVFFAEGGDFTGQLWLFWLAPIAGAIAAGLVCKLSKKA